MARRSFLILHGLENHRPPGHWQFWLAARLAEQGHEVIYPDLPDPDRPSYDAWERELHGLLGEMRGGERVVVCHSLACLLWLRAAGEISEAERPDRLLLVSPPESPAVPEGGAQFRVAQLDAEAVRASVRGETVIACSDDDPYSPTGAHELYGAPLGVRVDLIRGGGHITPDDGYGPWPSLEAWAHDPSTPLVPRP